MARKIKGHYYQMSATLLGLALMAKPSPPSSPSPFEGEGICSLPLDGGE